MMKTKLIFLPLALLLIVSFNSFSTTHNIDISGFAFSNTNLTVDPGDKVIWTNKDATSHTVSQGTSCPTVTGFDSGTLATNDVFEQTFNTPNVTIDYFCKFHCSMTGKIVVSSGVTETLSSTIVIANIKTFPNPFVTTSEVQVNLVKPGKVKVEIYDMYGHKLMELPEEEKEAGTQSFPISGESLRDGIFICKVYYNGKPAASEYLVKKSKS